MGPLAEEFGVACRWVVGGRLDFRNQRKGERGITPPPKILPAAVLFEE